MDSQKKKNLKVFFFDHSKKMQIRFEARHSSCFSSYERIPNIFSIRMNLTKTLKKLFKKKLKQNNNKLKKIYFYLTQKDMTEAEEDFVLVLSDSSSFYQNDQVNHQAWHCMFPCKNKNNA